MEDTLGGLYEDQGIGPNNLEEHIRFSTNDFSEIGFSNQDGSRPRFPLKFKLSEDGGVTWIDIVQRTPSFILPWAGDYIIHFTGEHYKPKFGNGIVEHAAAFTNIVFGSTFNVMEMSNMFQNCTSLTSIDVSRFNTSGVTNMTEMFPKLPLTAIGNWDSAAIYSAGDIVIVNDVLYVAKRNIMLPNVALGGGAWMKITGSHSMMQSVEVEPLTITAKENMAGISSGDIPD